MTFFKKTYLAGFLLLLPLVAGAKITTQNNPPITTGNNPPITTGNSLIGFQNPLNSNTICGALKLFLSALLTLAIPIAVLFIVYAGFLFVWARGKPEGLNRAKANLVYVLLGIGIFVGAWLLGQIILNTLNDVAKSTNNPNPQIGQCQ